MVAETFLCEAIAGRNILEEESIIGNKNPTKEGVSTQASKGSSVNLHSKSSIIPAICIYELVEPEGDQSGVTLATNLGGVTTKPATSYALGKRE
ncbi:hypothetical protein ACH5RR_041115 [Cinchona calisaya]|uniref:Uncharacterized protein n=1 Tax=Cinchona calisaya TaxID=153742 RepID=A0ABD2XU30_9GENT